MINRKAVTTLVTILMIVSAGCISADIESKVASENKIERYSTSVSMPSSLYAMMKSNSSNPIGEDFNGTMETTSENGITTINLTKTDISPDELENVTVEKNENGSLTYEDVSFYNSSRMESTDDKYADMITVSYTLTMPHDIKSTSADTVDENVATWNLNGTTMESTKITATTVEPPLFPSGTLPMVGAVLGVIALLIGGYYSIRRFRNE